MKWLFVAILLFSGCAVEEEGPSPVYPELEVDTAILGELPVAVGAHFEGAYLGVGPNEPCGMSGNWLHIDVAKLDTSRPVVPIRDPDMPCDPVQEDEHSWLLHCRQHVIAAFPFPNYWDRFTFTLEKESYTGYFHWNVDAGKWFQCNHVFEISEAEFFYDWR